MWMGQEQCSNRTEKNILETITKWERTIDVWDLARFS